jgi:hypothetical protein
MAPNPGRDAATTTGEMNDGPRHPAKTSRALAALQILRLLDSQAWRATRGAPFQFVRWLAALATVVVNWVQSGTLQCAASYMPVLAVVALLLLPDAQSIGIAGLRFDRLTNEVARQRRTVDRLLTEVSLINNSLIVGSQVNIALGTTAMAASAGTAAHSPHQRNRLTTCNFAVEGVQPDHEPDIS